MHLNTGAYDIYNLRFEQHETVDNLMWSNEIINNKQLTNELCNNSCSIFSGDELEKDSNERNNVKKKKHGWYSDAAHSIKNTKGYHWFESGFYCNVHRSQKTIEKQNR